MKKLRVKFTLWALTLMTGGFVLITKPVVAQSTTVKAELLQKFHLKLSRTVNGKTTLLDTIIVGTENASVRKLLTGHDIPGDRLWQINLEVLPGRGLPDSLVRKLAERRMIRVPFGQADRLDTLNKILRLREQGLLNDSARVQVNRIIRVLPPNVAFDSLVKADELRLNADGLPGRTTFVLEINPDSVNLLNPNHRLHKVTPGQKTVIIFKSEMKELTPADKKMLEKVVAPAELESKKELKLNNLQYYPNPSNGKFKLSFSAAKGELTTVKIYDQEGKEVYSEEFPQFAGSFSREIDISNFGQGIFFLRVVQGSNSLTKKLLIQ